VSGHPLRRHRQVCGSTAHMGSSKVWTDSLLEASLPKHQRLPCCFWTAGLAPVGCWRWTAQILSVGTRTGKSCMNPAIPASRHGRAILAACGAHLSVKRTVFPWNPLPRPFPPRTMLRARSTNLRRQSGFDVGRCGRLPLIQNCMRLHDLCCVHCCEVTPTSPGWGHRPVPDTYRMLNAFHNAGADVPLATWHQTASRSACAMGGISPTTAAETAISTSTRDGWPLGLLNGCYDTSFVSGSLNTRLRSGICAVAGQCTPRAR